MKTTFNSNKSAANVIPSADVLLNENKQYCKKHNKCILCLQFHSLLDCDVFKSKSLN